MSFPLRTIRTGAPSPVQPHRQQHQLIEEALGGHDLTPVGQQVDQQIVM
jgi:hypothetical protein